jgi:hypothetical protein
LSADDPVQYHHKTVPLHRLPDLLMFAQQAIAKRFHYASSSAA